MNIHHDELLQKVVVADFLFRCHFEGIKTTKFNYVIQLIELIKKDKTFMSKFTKIDRDVLFEFHLKFWNTAIIGIPVRSLL